MVVWCFLLWCGGVLFVVVWWCFCGGWCCGDVCVCVCVVVWCFCGGPVVFLWWWWWCSGAFCGGVAVVFLWRCGGMV